MQATVVNDRRHADTTPDGEVNVNISARQLYEICVKETKNNSTMEENIPSLSWFRFQF